MEATVLLLKYRKYTALFIAFAALYIGQYIFIAPDKATLVKYHLTVIKLKELTLTIALPYVIIWFIALLGYLGLKSYSESIGGSKDGQAFKIILRGILWLALWLPVSAVISGFSVHYYNAHPDSTASLIRFNNYINVALLFPAFWFIRKGSVQLVNVLRKQPITYSPQLPTIAYICFSALYVLLVVHDPARLHATQSATTASYYESDWLIITTLVIPRLIMWWFGLQAIQNIFLYRRRVNGVIYKLALNHLAFGISGVLLFTIALRCLQSLSGFLNGLGLAALLLFVYALLIALSIGYIYIFRGAQNLKNIEEL